MSSCKPVTCKSFVMGFATHGRNATKSGRALKYFSSRTRSILIRVRLIKRSTCGHSVSYNQELSAGVSHVPCWCLLQTVSIITMIPLSVQTCLNLTCIHLWTRVTFISITLTKLPRSTSKKMIYMISHSHACKLTAQSSGQRTKEPSFPANYSRAGRIYHKMHLSLRIATIVKAAIHKPIRKNHLTPKKYAWSDLKRIEIV